MIFFSLLSLPLTHLTLFFSFPFSPHSHRSTLSHFIRSTLSSTHAVDLLAYNSNSKPFHSSLSPNRFSHPIRSCFSSKLHVFTGLSGIPNSQFLQFQPQITSYSWTHFPFRLTFLFVKLTTEAKPETKMEMEMEIPPVLYGIISVIGQHILFPLPICGSCVGFDCSDGGCVVVWVVSGLWKMTVCGLCWDNERDDTVKEINILFK